ncbi:unnamed protein product, partial [Didymodactylos carnosus]
ASTSASSDIMFSEVMLIFLVLAIWLSAIGFCLHQYKTLRRLETQVHYCVSRKDPKNIGNIKIVAREQDSIIYKKKRYSTMQDNKINVDTLHYIRYIPTTIDKNILTSNELNGIRFSTTTMFTLPTQHEDINELEDDNEKLNDEVNPLLNSDARHLLPNKREHSLSNASALTVAVPLSAPSTLNSSWNSHFYETRHSTQHLCVPSLRFNRLSDGNISLPVPSSMINEHHQQHNNRKSGEQLLDPCLISKTVRRSLLALHRESQENMILRHKEKTQSESDVHGKFIPWKIKMKSKLKRTPVNKQHGKKLIHNDSSFDSQTQYVSTAPTVPIGFLNPVAIQTTKTLRRSLKHYPKYSTQSRDSPDCSFDIASSEPPTSIMMLNECVTSTTTSNDHHTQDNYDQMKTYQNLPPRTSLEKLKEI